MSSDNIFEFSKKLKEQQLKKQQNIDLDDVEVPEVSKPTLEQLSSFLQVLAYLRQISPDGMGRIEFDDFATRIVLIANKLPSAEFEPQVNVALEVEGLFPFIWHALEDDDPDSDIPTFDDVVKIAYYIVDQLEPEDEVDQ